MPLIAEFVLLAAIWGASFLFMRLGVTDFGPWATAGMRVLIASAFLLPVFWLAAVRQSFWQQRGKILFVGLLNAGIPSALYAFAVLHVSTGLAGITNATTPLSGALVAWIWLHERPSGWRLFGLGLGFVGVCLLVLGKSGFDASGQASPSAGLMPLLAMGAGLLATLCYGVGASFNKRYLSHCHPMAIASGSQMGAALGLALPTVLYWPSQAPSATAWWALLALGVFGSALAYVLFFRIMQRAGPSKTLTVTFLVPVFALAYGALFLGETVSLWMVLCGLVIVTGTALSTGFWTPFKAKPAQAADAGR